MCDIHIAVFPDKDVLQCITFFQLSNFITVVMADMERIGSRLTDYHEILYWVFSLRTVEKIQVWLQVSKNNRHYA
jgi:hypothetical protein